MRLSDFFPTEQVLRDGEFSALGLSNSKGPAGMLSFLEDARFAGELLDNPRICAVICRPEDGAALAERKQGVVLSNTPRLAYFQLHNRLAESPDYAPAQLPSVIPASCHISPLAYIAPTGVVLGENVTVEEFVSIHGSCRVGEDSVLHAGVKLGGPGYEFKYLPEGGVMDVTHCGSVELGKGVVLFENVTVHRAVYPWDKTVIGDECWVNAQSHIDHGVKLGRRVKVCAGCVISGRVEAGDGAKFGPGVVMSNRLTVGDGAQVLLGSVASKDVPDGAVVSGNFAVDHSAHLAHVKAMAHCPEDKQKEKPL